MKFLKSEHKDISQLLSNKGLTANQYSFRKKRGLLYIQIEGKKDEFCFYRKTTSELNADMKFIESTTYWVGQKKEIELTSWQEVLKLIDDWI